MGAPLASDYLGHGVGASAFGDLFPQAAVQRWLVVILARRHLCHVR